MVKNIKEVKADMKRKAKLSKVATAKSVVANVKSNSQFINKTEEAANKLYGVFENPSKTFVESKLKEVVASLTKMNGSVNARYARTLNDLGTVISLNLPNGKLIAQIEDLSGLHSKLAMLRVQAEASIVEEDTLAIDSTGFVVDPAEEQDGGETVAEEIDASDEIVAEEIDASDEIVAEEIDASDEVIGEETVAESTDEEKLLDENEDGVEDIDELSDDTGEELLDGGETDIEDIELDDSGVDDFVTNEILNEDEMNVLEENDEENEEEVTSSIKAKKLKTAKRIKNDAKTVEDGVMSQLMEELR